MRRGIINAVTAVCKNTTGAPRITERNCDLTEHADLRNIKCWLLMKCFDRLDRSRVDIAIAIELIPGGIERVAIAIIAFDIASDVHYLVLTQHVYLFSIEEWFAKNIDTTHRAAALFGSLNGKYPLKMDVCEE